MDKFIQAPDGTKVILILMLLVLIIVSFGIGFVFGDCNGIQKAEKKFSDNYLKSTTDQQQ